MQQRSRNNIRQAYQTSNNGGKETDKMKKLRLGRREFLSASALGAGALAMPFIWVPRRARAATGRIGFAMDTYTVPRWKNLDKPSFEAAVKAVETLDSCVGRIVEALDKVGGEALITADHGNVEQMEDE